MAYKVLRNLPSAHVSNFPISLAHTSILSFQLPTSVPAHSLSTCLSITLELSSPDFLTTLPPLHHLDYSSSVLSKRGLLELS